MGAGRVGDAGVEVGDMRLEPGQEFEVVLPALGGVTREVEGGQLGAPALTPELGTQGEAAVERDGLQAILHHGSDTHEADAVGHEGAEITGGGKRSCLSRSSRCWASRRSVFVLRTTMARILAASPTSRV